MVSFARAPHTMNTARTTPARSCAPGVEEGMGAVDLLCSRNAHAIFDWTFIKAGGARWTRAMGDQSAPIPKEIPSELGGIIIWAVLPRRAHLVHAGAIHLCYRRCSLGKKGISARREWVGENIARGWSPIGSPPVRWGATRELKVCQDPFSCKKEFSTRLHADFWTKPLTEVMSCQGKRRCLRVQTGVS